MWCLVLSCVLLFFVQNKVMHSDGTVEMTLNLLKDHMIISKIAQSTATSVVERNIELAVLFPCKPSLVVIGDLGRTETYSSLIFSNKVVGLLNPTNHH